MTKVMEKLFDYFAGIITPNKFVVAIAIISSLAIVNPLRIVERLDVAEFVQENRAPIVLVAAVTLLVLTISVINKLAQAFTRLLKSRAKTRRAISTSLSNGDTVILLLLESQRPHPVPLDDHHPHVRNLLNSQLITYIGKEPLGYPTFKLTEGGLNRASYERLHGSIPMVTQGDQIELLRRVTGQDIQPGFYSTIE